MHSGLPILPVTIIGSRRVLPKDSRVFQSGTIELVVGNPIETRNTPPEELPQLISRTRSIISASFNRALP